MRRAISVLRSAVCGSRFAIIVSSDARLTICDFCSACRVWGFVFCVLSATFTLMSKAGLDIPCLFPFTDIFLQRRFLFGFFFSGRWYSVGNLRRRLRCPIPPSDALVLADFLPLVCSVPLIAAWLKIPYPREA